MITGEQIKAARKLLGWSEVRLAEKSKLRVLFVIRSEHGTLSRQNAARCFPIIQATLEAAGVEFNPPDDREAGVWLRSGQDV